VLGDDYPGQDCALAGALEILGERWTLLIVRDAFFGVRRFDDFAQHLEISRAILSARLRKLVEHGVLAKAGAEYVLTPAGEELWPAVYALISWGARHRQPASRRYSHSPCDTELNAFGECERCAVRPPARDVVIAPRRPKRRQREDPVSIAMRRPHRLIEPLDTGSVREAGLPQAGRSA
jgi:DNA-binding HxlR family transcriptional regulator